VKIADPLSGETLPVGEQGEIWARGYLVMKEYFDMPEETAAAITADGWLRTGDLGTMDGRGYCTITGRVKDMIIRGGENIYPREIEEALFAHPGVAEAAVVGIPDPMWGESVAAVIRPSGPEPPGEEELVRYLRELLAPNKTPTTWLFVDELPLTPSGKVQRFVLRERLTADRATGR
jgi:fatty-acyl-CoA synthase